MVAYECMRKELLVHISCELLFCPSLMKKSFSDRWNTLANSNILSHISYFVCGWKSGNGYMTERVVFNFYFQIHGCIFELPTNNSCSHKFSHAWCCARTSILTHSNDMTVFWLFDFLIYFLLCLERDFQNGSMLFSWHQHLKI